MFLPRCCRTLKGLPDPPTGAVKMSGVDTSQPGRDINGRGLKQYHPASAFRIREGERKEKKECRLSCRYRCNRINSHHLSIRFSLTYICKPLVLKKGKNNACRILIGSEQLSDIFFRYSYLGNNRQKRKRGGKGKGKGKTFLLEVSWSLQKL